MHVNQKCMSVGLEVVVYMNTTLKRLRLYVTGNATSDIISKFKIPIQYNIGLLVLATVTRHLQLW